MSTEKKQRAWVRIDVGRVTFPQLFSVFISFACIAYLFWASWMYFHEKDKFNSSEVSGIVIAVITVLKDVVQYVVGSSMSSRKKDETIRDLQNNASQPPNKITVANIEHVTNVDDIDEGKRPPIGFRNPPV